MRALALAIAPLLCGVASAQDAAKPPEKAPNVIRLPEIAGIDAIRRSNGNVVHYYRVNYVSAEILKEHLRTLLPEIPEAQVAAEGPVTTPATFRTLLRIESTDEQWPVVRRALDMLDVAQPQVRVDAKIVEQSYTNELKLGMEAHLKRTLADTFFRGLDAKFPNRLDAINQFTTTFHEDTKYAAFDYIVDLAEAGAETTVRSKPSVFASQGEKASIRVGDSEPIVQQNISGNTVTATTIFKDTGLTLEVTPVLIGRDGVRVRITAELSRVSEFRVTATSQSVQVVNPVISTRRAETVITVQDGAEIVIGGLDYEFDRAQSTGIPLLKDIPVAGALFGSKSTRKERTSLVFFIRFDIVTPGEARLITPPAEAERDGK